MKKVKRSIFLSALLVITFVLAACGGSGTVAQGANNPDGGAFSIEHIQGDPHAYLGEIVLTGIVGNVSARDFTLQTVAGTFEVAVDYRGSQSFPQVGDKLMVEGRLAENRPCCGPGFTLTSTQFEAVE